jgi:hypothetical protein
MPRCLRRLWNSPCSRRSIDALVSSAASPSPRQMNWLWHSGGGIIPKTELNLFAARKAERKSVFKFVLSPQELYNLIGIKQGILVSDFQNLVSIFALTMYPHLQFSTLFPHIASLRASPLTPPKGPPNTIWGHRRRKSHPAAPPKYDFRLTQRFSSSDAPDPNPVHGGGGGERGHRLGA